MLYQLLLVLLGFAAMAVGIPYAPVSPAYSTISTDHGKLKHVMATLTPGLVFATGVYTWWRRR